MEFTSERTVITRLSDITVESATALYNAVKYIYSIAEEDFYNVGIKDALKVVLNNVTDPDCLEALGLRINSETCREMSSEAYKRILPLTIYSFAVRLPVLKQFKVGDKTISDEQLLSVYDAVMRKGAENVDNVITESYADIKQLVKKGKSIPPYSSDWYKTYIYTHVPELSSITNKNMFLLGFTDILFAMFHSCVEEELRNVIAEGSAEKIK
ncbi:MAG: hypothetical protein ACI4KH_08585 [Oscillospiraceae bacterium]